MVNSSKEGVGFARTPQSAALIFFERLGHSFKKNVPVHRYSFIREGDLREAIIKDASHLLGVAYRNEFYDGALKHASNLTSYPTLFVDQSTVLELSFIIAQGHPIFDGISEEQLRELLKGKIQTEKTQSINPLFQLKGLTGKDLPLDNRMELLTKYEELITERATPTSPEISRK